MKAFTEMTGSELVAYYNEQTGKSIKKFSTKAIGIAACEKVAPKVEKTPAKKKNAVTSRGPSRASQVLECLRTSRWSIQHLADNFGTAYKNITGDLYDIRNGNKKDAQLKEGEVLAHEREGMVAHYWIEEEGSVDA